MVEFSRSLRAGPFVRTTKQMSLNQNVEITELVLLGLQNTHPVPLSSTVRGKEVNTEKPMSSVIAEH